MILAYLLQAASEYGPTLTGTGSLTVSGIVLYLWNQQRKDYKLERAKTEERLEALAQDFRKIVTENTEAIAANAAATLALKDVLESNKFCPLGDVEIARSKR